MVVHDPTSPARGLIKRIVGLPSEEVAFQEGLLYVNGMHLMEPYLGGLPATLGLREMAWKLGDGEYLVMGDNRTRSTDSRDFGPVDAGSIAGRVWFRYWPLRSFGPVR